MSCHTWTYKKVSALTDEEKKHFGEEAVKKIENWWGFKETTEEIIEKVKTWYKRQPELYDDNVTPEEYALNMIKEFTEKRDAIRKAPFENWVKIHKNDYPTCFNHNGEMWIKIAFDVPFRAYCNPLSTPIEGNHILEDLSLFDGEYIGYYDKNEFIRGNNDELKRRIREFLDIHGEENIMFDFG